MKRATQAGWAAAALGLVLLTYTFSRAIVQPSPNTLTFAGTLRNGGAGAGGTHAFSFVLHKGARTCTTTAVNVDVATDGTFTAPIRVSDCAAGFIDGEALTLDVLVDGATLATGQALSPVPYAKFADVALNTAVSPQSNIARIANVPITLFVRTDGDDSACDGSANVAFSAAVAPACAFLTPGTAASAAPATGDETVTIRVAAGTYRVTGAGEVLVLWRRPVRLIIEGEPGVIFSGALASAPNVAVGGAAVQTVGSYRPVTVRNVQIERFGVGVLVQAANAELASCTLNAMTTTGMLCQGHSHCSVSGLVRITASPTAFSVVGHSELGINPTASVTLEDGAIGLYVDRLSSVVLATGSIFNVSDMQTAGVWCSMQSQCTLQGTLSVINSANGITLLGQSQAWVTGPVNIVGTIIGLDLRLGGQFDGAWMNGTDVTIAGNTGLNVVNASAVNLLGSADVQIVGGIDVDNASLVYAQVSPTGTVSGPINVARNSIYSVNGTLPAPNVCNTGSQCP